MRENNLELTLCRADGMPFSEKDGFIIAEPGKEYYIKVRIHRNEVGVYPFNSSYIKIGIYVDGVDVNYWKRIDLSSCFLETPEASFWGFKKSSKELQSFVFTQPKTAITEAETELARSGNSETLGRITAVFFESELAEGVFSNDINSSSLVQNQHFVEGEKKFWKQASATTVKGNANNKEVFKPLQRWRNISTEPARTLVVKYHTLDMVNIINNFSDSKPRAAPASAWSDGGNKRSHSDLVVDLCSDDEEEGSSEQDTKRKSSSLVSDEVEILEPIRKEIPLLDISQEEEN